VKIRSIHIKRFRSIRDASLGSAEQPLGDIVIIIGKNDSGKSNLLEALQLFFEWFPSSSREDKGPFVPDLWFGWTAEEPIEIHLCLEVSEEEQSTLLPELSERVIREGNKLSLTLVVFREDDRQMARWPTIVPPGFSLIKEIISGKFLLVPVNRDRFEPNPVGYRTPLVENRTLEALREMAGKVHAPERRPWYKYVNEIRSILPHWEGIELLGTELAFRHGEAHTTLGYTGGGSQAILALLHKLLCVPAPIIAIEEPENHLHPELVKRFLAKVKESSKQVFIVTHSPFIVDHAEPSNVWLAIRESEETRFEPIGNRERLLKALFDLGVRPSDVMFSNCVLLVEGPTDKVFYETLLSQFGIGEWEVSTYPMGGFGKTRYSIETWLEEYKPLSKPMFVAVDQEGANELEKAIRQGKITRADCYIAPGELEDIYPTEVLCEALKEIWKKTIKIEDIREKDRKKFLTETLQGEQDWNKILAREVAKRLNETNIPDDLREFLDHIRSKVSSLRV
jgi:hypothetical protein